MDKRLSAVIAVVITIAWAVSFMVNIFNPAYDPPATVHALMMIVAGAAFSNAIGLPGRRKDEDKEKHD